MNKLTVTAISYALTLVIGLGLGYWLFAPGEAVEGESILQDVKTIEIPCEKIEVYEPEAKKLVNLPKEVRKNKNMHVADAITIPDDGHEHDVSSVFLRGDDGVGRIKMFDYQKPHPLFSRSKRTTLEASYGASDIETTWEARIRHDVYRIKKARIGIVGNVRGDKSYFTGVGISYSW